MPEITAIYRVQQGPDIAPVFLVVSAKGGFSRVFGSILQAGSVARIENAAVHVAVLGESSSIFLQDLLESNKVRIPTYTASLSQRVREPSRGIMYKVQFKRFPMLYFGVDERGICRTGVHQDAETAFEVLEEWFSKLDGAPSGP